MFDFDELEELDPEARKDTTLEPEAREAEEKDTKKDTHKDTSKEAEEKDTKNEIHKDTLKEAEENPTLLQSRHLVRAQLSTKIDEEAGRLEKPMASPRNQTTSQMPAQSQDGDSDSDSDSASLSSGCSEANAMRFPEDFTFGVATAAFQIEGGASLGGRKPSIWDDFTKREGRIVDGATAAVACDHYHCFNTDIDIMSHLGIKAYRFSISWSRIIPNGEGAVNEEGVQFYSNLIDALISKGIEPWVTLYHWDLPSALIDKFNGWLGPKRDVMRAFGYFAKVCFERFGNRVRRWMTINEPWCVTVMGFASGTHAPGECGTGGKNEYVVAHNLLLAHAEAVRIYRRDFAPTQQGQIGIVLNVNYRWANSAEDEDKRAAQRSMDFELGWFADPIFFGDYPERMRTTCGDRLPYFTTGEKKILKNSSDFLGVNYYFATFASAPPGAGTGTGGRRMSGGVHAGSSWFGDMGVKIKSDDSWERTDTGWFITPLAMRDMLTYIHTRYKPPCGIVITENGCAFEPKETVALDQIPGALVPVPAAPGMSASDLFDKKETISDPQRLQFLRQHLTMVWMAKASGADVRGYFVWSLLDNFEWNDGYGKRFGIVHVDYATQKRTIKSSARFYAEVCAKGVLEVEGVEDGSYQRT